MKPSEKANWIVSVSAILLAIATGITQVLPDAQRLLPDLVSWPGFRYVVLAGIICGAVGNLLAQHAGRAHAEDVRAEMDSSSGGDDL